MIPSTPFTKRMMDALRAHDFGDAMDTLWGDCADEPRTVATQASPRAGSRLGHSVSVNISQGKTNDGDQA